MILIILFDIVCYLAQWLNYHWVRHITGFGCFQSIILPSKEPVTVGLTAKEVIPLLCLLMEANGISGFNLKIVKISFNDKLAKIFTIKYWNDTHLLKSNVFNIFRVQIPFVNTFRWLQIAYSNNRIRPYSSKSILIQPIYSKDPTINWFFWILYSFNKFTCQPIKHINLSIRNY